MRFVATTQGLDTDQSNPTAALLLHILSAVAEFERSMSRERTLSGIRAAQAAGKVVGRPRRIFRRDEVVRLRDEEGLSWAGHRQEAGNSGDDGARLVSPVAAVYGNCFGWHGGFRRETQAQNGRRIGCTNATVFRAGKQPQTTGSRPTDDASRTSFGLPTVSGNTPNARNHNSGDAAALPLSAEWPGTRSGRQLAQWLCMKKAPKILPNKRLWKRQLPPASITCRGRPGS